MPLRPWSPSPIGFRAFPAADEPHAETRNAAVTATAAMLVDAFIGMPPTVRRRPVAWAPLQPRVGRSVLRRRCRRRRRRGRTAAAAAVGAAHVRTVALRLGPAARGVHRLCAERRGGRARVARAGAAGRHCHGGPDRRGYHHREDCEPEARATGAGLAHAYLLSRFAGWEPAPPGRRRSRHVSWFEAREPGSRGRAPTSCLGTEPGSVS